MHTSQALSNRDEVVDVLLISSQSEAQASLRLILDQSNWLLHRVSTCREALTYLNENATPVVICERDLPDGDWKLVLNTLNSLPVPPNLIVTSRLANAALWAEVLNLGGYDVLAQPFDAQEVCRVVFLAWHAQESALKDRQNATRPAPGRAQTKSRAAT